MAANYPRIRAVHICDSAFVDTKNKWNLIGIFTNDIIINKFPAKLVFALYCEIEMAETLEAKLEIYLGRKRFAGVVAKAEAENIEQGIGVLMIPRIDLGVDRRCELRITAALNGGAAKTILRKQIEQGDVPD